MNIVAELRRRFAAALAGLLSDPSMASNQPAAPQGIADLLDLVRQSQDAKFGDYQANMAMPLGKRLARSPRDVAADLIARLAIDGICLPPEIAGPGFINLRLRDDWLIEQLQAAVRDPRLGIGPVEPSRTYIVDFSSPNVAKPMHVGHIRSTVIGDSLYRTLAFVGHRVIGDNHIGDWGTQFGMIIYGFRHFVDKAAYARQPLEELARLYRLVNQLADYQEGRRRVPKLQEQIAAAETALAQLRAAPPSGDAKADKKHSTEVRRAEASLAQLKSGLTELQAKLAAIDGDPALAKLVREHSTIDTAVLEETAKLHAGDAENLRLWREFLPPCLEAINVIYRRLGVRFDETLGESFYHDRLAPVVDDLLKKGLARESDGAICVFQEGSDVPMIVRKKDGAFLYATSDLATIQYRVEHWSPAAMLYVVDHRQSLHFEQLFGTARKWGFSEVELQHIGFGTVMGDDGRPFKTRSGDTVGLSSLLDEAVSRAHKIVSDNDDAKPDGPELSPEVREAVAETVGIAALKYADLSQNRTSDYVFSYDKMLAMTGNTATYMQYAYARVRSIFRRGKIDIESLRTSGAAILLDSPPERALALELLRFAEALDAMLVDYRPNQLTSYLFELANRYSSFFDQCPVLKAPTPQLRDSRLMLCDLTARTLAKGLELLGIDVVEQM